MSERTGINMCEMIGINILREMMEITMSEMTGINICEMMEIKRREQRLT